MARGWEKHISKRTTKADPDGTKDAVQALATNKTSHQRLILESGSTILLKLLLSYTGGIAKGAMPKEKMVTPLREGTLCDPAPYHDRQCHRNLLAKITSTPQSINYAHPTKLKLGFIQQFQTCAFQAKNQLLPSHTGGVAKWATPGGELIREL